MNNITNERIVTELPGLPQMTRAARITPMSLAEPPATVKRGNPDRGIRLGRGRELDPHGDSTVQYRVTTTVPAVVGRGDSDAYADFWQSWLAGQRQPETAWSQFVVADLFCGFGGLVLGVGGGMSCARFFSSTTTLWWTQTLTPWQPSSATSTQSARMRQASKRSLTGNWVHP